MSSSSSPLPNLTTGGPSSSFTSPESQHYRSPQANPDPLRLRSISSIHLGEDSKTLLTRHLKGMASYQQQQYDSSDDENRDSNAQFSPVSDAKYQNFNDRDSHHSSNPHSPSASATSGIAAMSLSFIINNNDDDQDMDDDDDEEEEDVDSNFSDEEMKESSTYDEDSSPPSSGGFDVNTMLNTVCAKQDCYRTIRGPAGSFCKYHKQSRFCRMEGCSKSAKTGGFCISHGGGKRCSHPDCTKSAKQGGLCISHGGGKRCSEGGCTKSALVGGFCSAHGGGRKCKTPDCTKTALLGGSCIAHGGGKRCQVEGCSKSAVGGSLCVSHGGGKRCQAEGCNKGAVRNGVCIRHGAKREGGSDSRVGSPINN